jgi:hypothetical protein
MACWGGCKDCVHSGVRTLLLCVAVASLWFSAARAVVPALFCSGVAVLCLLAAVDSLWLLLCRARLAVVLCCLAEQSLKAQVLLSFRSVWLWVCHAVFVTRERSRCSPLDSLRFLLCCPCFTWGVLPVASLWFPKWCGWLRVVFCLAVAHCGSFVLEWLWLVLILHSRTSLLCC